VVLDGRVGRTFPLETLMDTSGDNLPPQAVAKLFAAGGLASITRLGGAYALAVWETRERRLTLVRDPMGLKPLCYAQEPDGTLYFASEPKALVAAGVVRPVLNFRALSYYLANQTSPGSDTLFEGIYSVPPGRAVIWEEGKITIRPCELPGLPEPGCGAVSGEKEVAEQFANVFWDAVRWGLRGGGAPGMLLSGSLGSAVLLNVLHEMAGNAQQKTFSVTFTGEDTNALDFARRAAQTHATEHHELVLSPEEFFASLPTAIWHQDAPIAHPSRIALYHAAAFASSHVGEVWSAAGCDELFASHPRYRQGLAAARLGRVRARLARMLTLAATDIREVYLDSVAVFSSAGLKDLLAEGACQRGAVTEPYSDLLRSLALRNGHDFPDHLLAVDHQVWLPEVAMTQDRAGMAVSVNAWSPFLDHQVAGFLASVPARLKLRGRTSHYLLRHGMGQKLPASIRERSFAPPPVPVGRWLRSSFRPILHEYVLSDLALSRGLMNPDAVGKLVAAHETGRADHTRSLWSLINLEVWQRLYLDGEAVTMDAQRVAAGV
jgi:asparagine synthase (glutamine-hydrolysing)